MRAGRARAVAFAALAAAAGFTLFFFAAKHRPGLAAASPFAEDPYDAVGSFAVQLAALAAILAAFRAGPRAGARAPLILGSAAVALLAIFAAASADVVALIRHPEVWLHSAAGHRLAALVLLFGLASAAGAGAIACAPALRPAPSARAWAGAAAIALAAALALPLYPETWRRGLAGAVLTALFGMALLFVEVWGFALVLLPRRGDEYDDLLDDLAAAFGRGRSRAAGDGATAGAEARSRGFPRWLRRHHWRIVTALALAGGIGLAAAEAFGEGLPEPARKAALVLGVFTGIEAAGILLGYALFWRRLGLIRAERAR